MKPLRNVGSSQEYSRAALILIVRERFRAFVEKFGREPGPHESLFFDKSQARPVQADHATVTRQIQEAGRLAGVKTAPVFTFLGLAPLPKTGVRSWLGSSRRVEQHSRECSQRQALIKSPVWTRFLADKRIHRRHRITAKELKLVAHASFLGDVKGIKDILLVLNVIRGGKRVLKS